MATRAPAKLLRDLSESERDAWVNFLRAHTMLVRALDADLQHAHGMPLAAFDVLAQLMRADGERQMSDLASALLLSPSGCTRLVDRLENDGLVARRRSDKDSRVVIAAITTAGRRQFATALPTHMNGIRARYLSRLTDDELGQMNSTLKRLLATDEEKNAPAC